MFSIASDAKLLFACCNFFEVAVVDSQQADGVSDPYDSL